MHINVIFIIALLQSVNTGTFLTLDVVTHSLKNAWGFHTREMIKVGTLGYAIGAIGVSVFSLTLLTKVNTFKLSIIAAATTVIPWILLRIFLCKNCIYWQLAVCLEAFVAFGTTIGYLVAIQLVQKFYIHNSSRKWRIIGLSLSVSIGSIYSFALFKIINDVATTFTVQIFFSTLVGALLIWATKIELPADTVPLCAPTEVVQSNLVVDNRRIFTPNFGIYLIALSISFGVILTYINSASDMIVHTNTNWDPEIPLICMVLGNFAGRGLGFAIKDQLTHVLHVFAVITFITGSLQFSLSQYWNIELIVVTLMLLSIFFGLIWALTLPLAKEFFNIAEDRALGNCYIGVAVGPLIFGPIAAFIYDQHAFGDKCDQFCYASYFYFVFGMQVIATVVYEISWLRQKLSQ